MGRRSPSGSGRGSTPSSGTGRPEEVVAALADELGAPLAIDAIVRERLLLADELADESAETGCLGREGRR